MPHTETWNPFDQLPSEAKTQEPQNAPAAAFPDEPAARENPIPRPKAQTTKARKPAQSSKKKSGRRGSDDNQKEKISIYVTHAQRLAIRRACLDLDIFVTDLGCTTLMDYINHTYVCTNPECGCQFTMSTVASSETAPAIRCPACTCDNVAAIK